ncbi:MAG: phosphatidylglycerophosphatase A [Bryobacteraceae bacterium]|jgi:phosphatidylglycerophosphatase A
MKSRAAFALATWFGCGYWPFGPGTAGSLGSILAGWLACRWTELPPAWLLAAVALLLLPAVRAAAHVARVKGSSDPGIIVIDEVLGQWIALAALGGFHLAGVAAAFCLFRIFDIFKPWPVRAAEKLPGGWGIVADDLLAGAWAALVLLAGRALAANMVQS